MSLVFKDAFWQISGRVVSALAGFFVIKLITPYLWPLRYGDYSTVLKYFAIWSALADFWIYVVALNAIWKVDKIREKLEMYHKFLWFRFFMVLFIYILAFILAFFVPAYVWNPFIVHGLALGMFFSATFMIAWIVQLPLQLNWQMKHVSFALIFARISQILLLLFTVFFLFPKWDINFQEFSPASLRAFMMILFTVFVSSITQFVYVLIKWKEYMNFKLVFDKKFILWTLKENRQYWFSYYLSSFHTLIVLIFLSILFPTKDGFEYVWVRTLALALIEILLIVPSAFWNSIIHKISKYPKDKKLKSLWSFLTFILWFWFLMLWNFMVFNTQIVDLIAWEGFLSSSGKVWSDFILPFLAFVLFLSFIKQSFNYILVSFSKQNKLFHINLVWVIIWVIVWLVSIPRYWIYGWIATQILLEICFVLWILIVSYKWKILPKIQRNYVFYSFLLFLIFLLNYFVDIWNSKILFVFYAFFLNMLCVLFSYKIIRKLMDDI